MLKGSWKTSVLGWLILLGSIITGAIAFLDNDPNTVFDFQQIIAGLAGVGLIAARDNDKSTEQVKAAGEVKKTE